MGPIQGPRGETWVYFPSIFVIAGSNPTERNAYCSLVFDVCRIISGLCYELITCLGDSYRVSVWVQSVEWWCTGPPGGGVELHMKRGRKIYV
jgi:hypothetical protein